MAQSDPLNPPTPVISTANIGGSPLITASGVLAAIAQYLAVQGAAFPHDTSGWISFGVGLLIAAVGALMRKPGGQ